MRCFPTSGSAVVMTMVKMMMMGFQPVHVAIFFRFHVVRTRLDVLFTLAVGSAAGTGMLLLYATLEGFLELGLELAGFLWPGTGLPEGRHFVVVGDGRYFGRFGVQIEDTSVVAGRSRSRPGPGLTTATWRTGCGRGSGYRNLLIVRRVPVHPDVVGPYLVACCSSLENGHHTLCNAIEIVFQIIESNRIE